MANKNVILFSYYFPPLGMGGVGRAWALYKFLPSFGYNVHVITVKDILFPNYDYSIIGDTLLDNVHRTGSHDPARILYKLGVRRLKASRSGSASISFFNYPDSKKGWNRFAIKKTEELLKKHDVSAIITTSPPPSTHLIGLKLKEMYNIPWVADFRDFWFSQPIELIYKDSKQKEYSLNLKKDIIKKADGVVAVNNSIRDYFGRGTLIYNSVDINMASLWRNEKVRNRKDNSKLIIAVLGTINHLCPIDPLFSAIRSIFDADVTPKERIKIVHIGHSDKDEMRLLIQKYSLEGILEFPGYLPKQDAIRAASKADILFFSVSQFEKYHILPGRIFDYLISGKPIIGVVPSGSDAETLLTEYNYGVVTNDYSGNQLADYLGGFINDKSKVVKREISAAELNRFSNRTMAGKFARVLDEVIG
ncbi:MAG: hypothetical protein ABIJ45_15290 [Candidatus Zixiibacteriota bacterium]